MPSVACWLTACFLNPIIAAILSNGYCEPAQPPVGPKANVQASRQNFEAAFEHCAATFHDHGAKAFRPDNFLWPEFLAI